MTDPAASLRAAHEAVTRLVNLYFDRVPVEQLDCELLAETIHEGLSDEWDRLYRIEAAAVEPSADRADLRQHLADALYPTYGQQDRNRSLDIADVVLAVLFGPIPADTDTATWTAIRAIQLMNEAGRQRDAVLPAPTDRAAVLWAADFAEDVAESLRKHHEFERANGALDVMTELRRMADETQLAEHQPPRHRWAATFRDPVADEWIPGTRFLNRQHAVQRYEAAIEQAPAWKDGTPVERRLVRETTTYTVEAEHTPAAGARQDGDRRG